MKKKKLSFRSRQIKLKLRWSCWPPPWGTELGSLTTANFCFFTWKITNILSDSDWNQCAYFFHLPTSLDLTMRDTAHQKTWHFKTKHKKNQKIINQERWKQLLVKCKGIMYRCRVFYLDSTLKSIYNKEIFIWHNLLHIILLVGINSPRKWCWEV